MAIREINDKSDGVADDLLPGVEIDFYAYDTALLDEVMTEFWAGNAPDNLVAMFGPMVPDDVSPVSSVAEHLDVLHMMFAPVYTGEDAGSLSFGIAPYHPVEVYALASLLRNYFDWERCNVIYTDDESHGKLKDAFLAVLPLLDMSIGAVVAVPTAGQITGMQESLFELQASGVIINVLFTTPKDAWFISSVIDDINQLGYLFTWVGDLEVSMSGILDVDPGSTGLNGYLGLSYPHFSKVADSDFDAFYDRFTSQNATVWVGPSGETVCSDALDANLTPLYDREVCIGSDYSNISAEDVKPTTVWAYDAVFVAAEALHASLHGGQLPAGDTNPPSPSFTGASASLSDFVMPACPTQQEEDMYMLCDTPQYPSCVNDSDCVVMFGMDCSAAFVQVAGDGSCDPVYACEEYQYDMSDCTTTVGDEASAAPSRRLHGANATDVTPGMASLLQSGTYEYFGASGSLRFFSNFTHETDALLRDVLQVSEQDRSSGPFYNLINLNGSDVVHVGSWHYDTPNEISCASDNPNCFEEIMYNTDTGAKPTDVYRQLPYFSLMLLAPQFHSRRSVTPLAHDLTGSQQLAAMMMAVHELNDKADGVLDDILPSTLLEVLVRNSGRDDGRCIFQTMSVSAAAAINMMGLLGSTSTTCSVSSYFVVRDFNVLQATYSASSSILASKESYPTLIQMVPPNTNQVLAMLDFINSQGWRNIAMLSSNDGFGQSGAQSFVQAVTRYFSDSISIVQHVQFTANAGNIDYELEVIESSKSWIVVLICEPRDAYVVYEEAYYSGMLGGEHTWLSFDLGFYPDAWPPTVPAANFLGIFGLALGTQETDKYKGFTERWANQDCLTDEFVSGVSQNATCSLEMDIEDTYIWLMDKEATLATTTTDLSDCAGICFDDNFVGDLPWAYDTVLAFAYAVQYQLDRGNFGVNFLDMADTFPHIDFEGVTGRVQFNSNLSRVYSEDYVPRYYILNHHGDAGVWRVAYWEVPPEFRNEEGFILQSPSATTSYLHPCDPAIDAKCTSTILYTSGSSDIPADRPPCSPGEAKVGDDCVVCPAGTFSNVEDALECTNCPPGYYSRADPDPPSECLPCPKGEAQGLAGQPTCIKCQAAHYSDHVGSTQCTPCPEGTTHTESGATTISTCICREGYYGAGVNCSVCPLGGICSDCTECTDTTQYCCHGVVHPQPDGGYTRGVYNDSIVTCHVEEACFAVCDAEEGCDFSEDVPIEDIVQNCAKGYSGERCAECDAGFYRLNTYCRRCHAGMEALAIMFILLPCLRVLVCLYLSYHQSRLGSAAVFVNFMQVLSSFTMFNVEWPRSVFSILSTAAIFDFNPDTLAPGCYFPNFSEKSVYTRWAVWNALPPIVVVLFYGLFRIVEFIAKRRKEAASITPKSGTSFARTESNRLWITEITSPTYTTQQRRNLMCNSVTMLIYILYSSITATNIQMFRCETLEDGTSILIPYPFERCDGTHDRVIPIAVFFFFTWSVCIPLGYMALCFWIYRHKALQSDFVQNWFGLLVNSYREEWFFFDAISMVRKTGVMVCLVMFNDTINQLTATSFILFVYIIIIVHARPFRFGWVNYLQILTDSTVYLTLTAGTLMDTSSLSPRGEVFVTSAIWVFIAFSVLGAALIVYIEGSLKFRRHLYGFEKSLLRSRGELLLRWADARFIHRVKSGNEVVGSDTPNNSHTNLMTPAELSLARAKSVDQAFGDFELSHTNGTTSSSTDSNGSSMHSQVRLAAPTSRANGRPNGSTRAMLPCAVPPEMPSYAYTSNPMFSDPSSKASSPAAATNDRLEETSEQLRAELSLRQKESAATKEEIMEVLWPHRFPTASVSSNNIVPGNSHDATSHATSPVRPPLRSHQSTRAIFLAKGTSDPAYRVQL
eukprot:Rmarinus@m.25787